MLEQCYNIYTTYIQHLKTAARAYFQKKGVQYKKQSSQQVEKPARGDSSGRQVVFASGWKVDKER